MIKYLGLLTVLLVSAHSYANDPLNGTLWKTIDDKTQKPMSIVKFTENRNGTLSANIQKVFESSQAQKCTKCVGKYQNKPLIGANIISNLKSVGHNKYTGGHITDPQTGKTYKFNATLSENGQILKGRGFIGVSALGRSQTWHRVP
ncbi:hypothetical protein A7P53_04095 [Acinetobacter defluvii]|uniref:DUF2147 domain-containing protein n=1 Tax=Acinetobacter defluvii TaxID=1871111 RepID=A0A2S2FCY9_9GAMM|nr:DUF2147 domain-containing protein [Acinetobacter defluvii]AWL28750.1 DUF2147 domain-containing protein [Acinetobacter defluvii]NNP71649.1 hypothetical protein [Acinetobacter defluvii]